MVKQQRMTMRLPAVIALGSNLGDREQALRDAVKAIHALPGVVVTGASDIVESPALRLDGVDKDAPSYLNAVITVRSSITPEQLLDGLNAIEDDLGRVRGERWGDRIIDLDIITAAGRRQQSERLTLPHPRAWQRAFVLVPWLQLAPLANLPGYGRVAELATEVSDSVTPWPARPLMDEVRR